MISRGWQENMGKNSTMHIWRYVMIVFVVLAGLGGCQTKAPMSRVTATYEFVPLAMNARELVIERNWQMSAESDFIGYRAKISPSDHLAEWASQVMLTAGSGQIIFDISRASVRRIALPQKTDLKGFLTDQQEYKIKAELDVKITRFEPISYSEAFLSLQASYSETIPESASANDLQNAIGKALMGAITSLDQKLRQELDKIDNIILP